MKISSFSCNTTLAFPCDSQYLDGTTYVNSNFDDHAYYKYIMFGIFGVFFVSVLIYFFLLRKEVSFKARSLKLIALGVILIALDSFGTSNETHLNKLATLRL